MVQKRPLEVEKTHEISSKLPRQEPCNNLSLFPDINSFEDAGHVSGLSVKGGFSETTLVYEKELLSIERDSENSPGRDDDPDSSLLPGNHSFSSGGTSSTSEEDVLIQAPFNTCFFPEYFYPERSVTRREVIYSLLLECPPQKKVSIGPLHQADIPQLKDADGDINQVDSLSGVKDRDKFEEPLAGTSIIPMPTTALSVDSVVEPEHGIIDCNCLYKGSIRCVRQHVMEERDKLKTLLGLQVFEELGFSNMGEEVAEKWTEEEESLFHEVVFSNPSSMGRNFWSCLSHSFPSRTKAEIVSYYFNVFMLRKRAEQNRLDPMNANSDNDEWQAIEEEDEDSVVESPSVGSC
ncbi:hypothetical protein MLD38_039365 [Melastoma candidum]|uniref:Uncharacterized protein n=1 Tax=Melastoma candidum TaxID=119954 RepID=A0ACB9L2Q7_9MYRT|nr:hypothetical protein MLD38_039365 [Melastoma candidum]